MSARRDLLLLLGLFAALVALIALGPGRGERAAGISASSHVSGPGGALALQRWLTALGYDVRRMEYSAFAPGPEDDLLIVLEPSERYSREEAEAVRAWVEAGGTLLVAETQAGPGSDAAPLLEAFDLQVAPGVGAAPGGLAPVLQPALGAPVSSRLDARSRTVITGERDDLAPLAGATQEPVLAGLQVGAGYLFASSAIHPFTNEGLRDDEHAAVVVNMLRRIPPGGRVVFDEIHHGFVGQTTLRTLLLGTAWGQAAVYAILTLVAYLVLTGRRFGRPVPLRAETARRSSAEYLESMAGLLRRAGKSTYVLEHYRSVFKRRLARAYGLSPDLDDDALVAAVAQTRPSHARAVADLLARMGRTPVDDKGLLTLVAEADALLER